MRLEELERWAKVDVRRLLSRRVPPIGTELDVVKDAVTGIKRLRLAERDIVMTGLERHTPVALAALAEFKDKVKRNVAPLPWAKKDEIAVMPIRPEAFGLDTFERTGLTVGTGAGAGMYHIIPDTTGTWEPKKDEEIIVITDILEINPNNVVTAVQGVDVDGTKMNPESIRTSVRATDIQHFELSYPIISNASLDIDGKVEFDGDAEIVPVGLHIALGTRIPDLT